MASIDGPGSRLKYVATAFEGVEMTRSPHRSIADEYGERWAAAAAKLWGLPGLISLILGAA